MDVTYRQFIIFLKFNLKIFQGHEFFFGLLVMSHLDFKARVRSLIHTWQRCTCSLKFMPGVTPVVLLTTSMGAGTFSSTFSQLNSVT